MKKVLFAAALILASFGAYADDLGNILGKAAHATSPEFKAANRADLQRRVDSAIQRKNNDPMVMCANVAARAAANNGILKSDYNTMQMCVDTFGEDGMIHALAAARAALRK